MNLLESQSSYFFGFGLSDEAKAFINSKPQNGEEDCQKESGRWLRRLAGAGFDVEIVHGFYGDDQGRDLVGHTWLTIDGAIFDPTAIQFGDFPNIDEDNYDPHERYTLDELS